MKNGVKGMLQEKEEQEDINYMYMKPCILWSAHVACASCREIQG